MKSSGVFMDLWQQCSRDHETLSNNDGIEFTTRITRIGGYEMSKLFYEICYLDVPLFFKKKLFFWRVESCLHELYVAELCFAVFDDSLWRQEKESCIVGMGQIS